MYSGERMDDIKQLNQPIDEDGKIIHDQIRFFGAFCIRLKTILKVDKNNN